jgi:hypothetical protein
MAGSPPLLRDQLLDLATLRRLAEEYDAISAADGRHWPAIAFIEWLVDEQRASVELADKPVVSAAA